MTIQLSLTEEGLRAQLDEMLVSAGLPLDNDHRQLMAGLIFQSEAHTDEVDVDKIAKQARGMLARRQLYFIMKPEKKSENAATSAEEKANAS